MTVGELLTSFPWSASVEVLVPDENRLLNVEWSSEVYGFPNLPPETAKRKVKRALVEHGGYEDFPILSIHTE